MLIAIDTIKLNCWRIRYDISWKFRNEFVPSLANIWKNMGIFIYNRRSIIDNLSFILSATIISKSSHISLSISWGWDKPVSKRSGYVVMDSSIIMSKELMGMFSYESNAQGNADQFEIAKVQILEGSTSREFTLHT